jgi:glycosyltransferase involved in cell wall biosynthesis
VVVIGHLRREKDPLRTAYALRDLPRNSALHAVHAGRALTPAWALRAQEEMKRNPRYRWLGELTPTQVVRLLTPSHLLVHSSRMEGGANAVSEALRAGVPILASRVSGNVGLLGADHPGLFPCGDTRQLRSLLRRAERSVAFLDRLREASRRRAPLFAPAVEAGRWRVLVAELTGRSPLRR